MERLEQHFESHKVTADGQRRALFLSWVGPEIYNLIKKLVPDANPADLTFIDLKKKVAEFFESKVNITAARFKFFRTNKSPSNRTCNGLRS